MTQLTLSEWQRRAWRWALGCFLLAGLTGVVFRFGLVWGLPPGFAFEKLRHAHSHLMDFGWVTPALFSVMYALVPGVVGHPVRRPRAAAWIVGLTVSTALLSYPFFLLYGYEPVRMGSAEVPLAAITASFNVLAWYALIWLFRGELGGTLEPDQPYGSRHHAGTQLALPTAAMVRSLWSAALVFLALSSLGAWGRGALGAAGVHDPFWQDAAVHLFLDVFSDGWMVLALLGAGYTVHTKPGSMPSRWAIWGRRLAVAGVPLSFLVAIPVYLVPSPARAIAGLASSTGGVGMLLLVADLARIRRPDPLWSAALAALALKAAAAAAIALPPAAEWAEGANLRLLYLHLLLLGGITLGLVSVVYRLGGLASRRAGMAFAVAASIMLTSLLGLTTLWPAALRGPWVLQWAAWAAALLWIAALRLAAAAAHRPNSPTASATPGGFRSGGRSGGEAGSRWDRRRPSPAGCEPPGSPPASAPP